MRIVKVVLLIFAIISLLPIYMLILVFALLLSLLLLTTTPTNPDPNNTIAGFGMMTAVIKAPFKFIIKTWKEIFDESTFQNE